MKDISNKTIKLKIDFGYEIYNRYNDLKGVKTLILTSNNLIQDKLDFQEDNAQVVIGKFKDSDRYLIDGLIQYDNEMILEIYDLELNDLYICHVFKEIVNIFECLNVDYISDVEIETKQTFLNVYLDIKGQKVCQDLNNECLEFYNKKLHTEDSELTGIGRYFKFVNAEMLNEYYSDMFAILQTITKEMYTKIVFNFLYYNKLFRIEELTKNKNFIKQFKKIKGADQVALIEMVDGDYLTCLEIFENIEKNMRKYSVFEEIPDSIFKYLNMYEQKHIKIYC